MKHSFVFSLLIVGTALCLATGPAVAGGGGSPLLFSDDFNRADGAMGSDWGFIFGEELSISSNQACSPGAPDFGGGISG